TFANQPDVASALAFAPDSKSLFVGRMDGSAARLQLKAAAAQSGVPQAQPYTAIADSPTTELTEQEPNNAPKTAMAISIPAKISGVIVDGADLFRFRAKAGEQWVLEINAARSKSPLDSKVEVLDATGAPIERVRLQAVRKSWLTFRGKNSSASGDFRMFKWREMTLNQYLYLNGEVVKLWHYPRGPDSGYLVYPGSGTRHAFFDTTPLAHPMGQFAYIVNPLPAGITPPANGLPTFPIYFENDDDSQRRLGKDSKLTFTAPRDGEFLASVSDVRGAQGKDYKYTLTIRPRRANFSVSLSGVANVPKGSGREFSVRAVRMDNFTGPIRVDITDVPAGFRVTTPLTIEAGQTLAYGAVYHAPGKPSAPKPVSPNPAINKLTWKLFHGSWPKVPDWSALKPVKTGELKHGFFEIDLVSREDNFGMLFEGQIKIPKNGTYEFILASDDGSLLFIDGKKIVDNDGLHGKVRKSGKVDLKAGMHAIRVSYIEAAGMEELYVGWKGPGFAEASLSFADAAPASFAKATATARINGKNVLHPVNNLSGLKLIAQSKLQVQVLPASGKLAPGKPLELTIAPGETISARVVIGRNGTKGRVSFGSHDSGRNLPHGVYVDNIGLSGLLIVEGQTEREFFITADKWVPEMTRRFHLRTGSEKGVVSQPILLHVRKR
ncbi:MAG: PA14 domain-containing protein, partial [Verrucomicrobiia bacterium]